MKRDKRYWQEEELLLLVMRSYYGSKILSKMLNRPVSSVENKARKIGLKLGVVRDENGDIIKNEPPICIRCGARFVDLTLKKARDAELCEICYIKKQLEDEMDKAKKLIYIEELEKQKSYNYRLADKMRVSELKRTSKMNEKLKLFAFFKTVEKILKEQIDDLKSEVNAYALEDYEANRNRKKDIFLGDTMAGSLTLTFSNGEGFTVDDKTMFSQWIQDNLPLKRVVKIDYDLLMVDEGWQDIANKYPDLVSVQFETPTEQEVLGEVRDHEGMPVHEPTGLIVEGLVHKQPEPRYTMFKPEKAFMRSIEAQMQDDFISIESSAKKSIGAGLDA